MRFSANILLLLSSIFTSNFGHRDALPSKINARIKLGFSKTLAACHLEENQILFVNDVVSPGENDYSEFKYLYEND